ncbi:selenoneine biosynthesis selenosugar synthase SenB [Cupriavidus consociatus]|uniref:selenoneine biosynthesis selenosugar synthase SenB n=1 Tax=Cupriavidus consociatus TaxID=2821357 RepID=UPI001AE3DA20|nr:MULTISPECIES: selenoneine biosynthesis selenosugar synthase SenB [unclassified Cupriavidus]MBP0618570.1 TIGR04348 family glycosyltransferase [Cupriavidus sp. LEh25]MDK2655208.1 selenoneine biosynthesis selenosugar synthase SenB [Cupriavidus sp. LEh21]
MRPPKATVAIISPALRNANNGNWQTAHRWSHILQADYGVTLAAEWSEGHPDGAVPACLIALHARRSADSIARFAEACPGRPLVVVLTGTDLYRDIRSDASARRSLDLATHLVVLQDEGPAELSPGHRAKCRVIYQSAPAILPAAASRDAFDVVLVGHMRPEKDPATPMRALMQLPEDSRVRLAHIGAALDDSYREAAEALQAQRWPGVQRYVWLANLPHSETRRRIGQAQAMVISSMMEGGANVIIEAVTSGVPVLASRIPGNLGMLGRDYEGYFPPGDAAHLATMLERASRDAAFLERLRQQCAQRAPLFAPERERAEVIRLVAEALQPD